MSELELLLFFNNFAPQFTLLINGLIYSLYVCILGLICLHRKSKIKLLRLLACLVLGSCLVMAMKYGIDRPRPYEHYPVVATMQKTDPSFPSMHAFLAFMSTHFWPTRLRGLALLYAGALGIALLVAGIHWPTDVLASIALGLCFPLLLPERLITSFKAS